MLEPMPRPTLAIPRLSLPVALLLCVGIVAVAEWVIHAMGHPLICKCGYVKIWYGGRGDSQMSQHLTDWYTYSHILHGIIFYWLLSVLAKGREVLIVGEASQREVLSALVAACRRLEAAPDVEGEADVREQVNAWARLRAHLDDPGATDPAARGELVHACKKLGMTDLLKQLRDHLTEQGSGGEAILRLLAVFQPWMDAARAYLRTESAVTDMTTAVIEGLRQRMGAANAG